MVPHLNAFLHEYLRLLILSWKLMPFAVALGWLCGVIMRRETTHDDRVRAWLRGEPIR